MKFDVVIGNPPYQDEIKGNNRAIPIYNAFMEESYKLANIAEFITPARFLFNAGQTPADWNKKMLSDPHIKVIFFEQNSARIFSNTDIKGGVAITYRNTAKNFGEIGTFISNESLRSIAVKVKGKIKYSLSEIHYNRSSYRLSKKVYADNPSLLKLNKSSERFMLGSNIFTKMPSIFFDKINIERDKCHYAQILGREDNNRVHKYIKKQYLSNHPNLDKWKVFLAKSNGTGEIGERLSSPEVGQPYVVSTQTFISFGAFETEIESKSLIKYLKSKFLRTLLSIKKVTPDNARKDVWEFVPLEDFTENSDIDWSQSISNIDQQLYKKYDLNDEEIEFIESNIKEME